MNQKFTLNSSCARYLFLKITFSSILLLIFSNAFSQKISTEEILNLVSCPLKKLDNVMHRKGFVYNGRINYHDSSAIIFGQRKPDSTRKQIEYFQLNNCSLINFQTTSPDEVAGIKTKLISEGYFYDEKSDTNLFQKSEMVISFKSKPVDSVILYTVSIHRKNLPQLKEISYAEDLLQLTSHEYLCTVFGATNVKKDQFIISSHKTVPCTVLFPHTRMEVVFIWEDGNNYRKLAAVRIGGDPQTRLSLQYPSSIEQNTWQFKNGLYIGMSLQELRQFNTHNSQNANSYSRFVQHNETSAVNNTALVLSCLNCGDSQYVKADFNHLPDAAEERKIYLSTIILFTSEK
ncbi:MAG TPA: hypothetical protein VFQ58_05490 [Flavisolibacter sp.]|nr:hypothetical protein [Flavisolibacter sp.]